jgi:acetyltransferase-like isoleucine patch superfamily enzyme
MGSLVAFTRMEQNMSSNLPDSQRHSRLRAAWLGRTFGLLRSFPEIFRYWSSSLRHSLETAELSRLYDCSVNPSALIPDPEQVSIGPLTRIEADVRLLTQNGHIRVGKESQINVGSILRCDGGDILIGDGVSIQYYSIIYGAGGVSIGDNCRISSHVKILAVNHNYSAIDLPIRAQGVRAEGIIIEDDVWIGAGAVLLDGVRIGRGSVIGAGSVVTKSVVAYSVVAGNPARVLKTRGASFA